MAESNGASANSKGKNAMSKNRKQTQKPATPATPAVAEVQQTPATPEVVTPADAPKVKAARYKAIPEAHDKFVVVVVKDPKKRGESAKRFACYRPGMTMAQYLEAATAAGVNEKPVKKALALSDLRWDYAHGFIDFQPVEG